MRNVPHRVGDNDETHFYLKAKACTLQTKQLFCWPVCCCRVSFVRYVPRFVAVLSICPSQAMFWRCSRVADKTCRGLRGHAELGKLGGDNSHGYDVVKQFRTDGEPIRGDCTSNTAGAEVFGRIFHDYVVETSSKRIDAELNEDAIPAPGGGNWGFSTINGNAKCGNGILNNEMYIGRIVWIGRDDAFITTARVLIRPRGRGAQQFDLPSSY
jgi:hypothetical protein